MAGYTDSSHNMLFTMNPSRWNPDLAKSGKSDLTGYQEAEGKEQRDTLKAWCAKNNRELYLPANSGNPISYKPMVFEPYGPDGTPMKGCKQVHASAEAMGVPIKYNPGRDYTYVGLRHLSSGKTVLRINVHPIAGSTRPAVDDLGVKASQWKNWACQQYWLDVISFTARELSRGTGGVKSQKRFWDVITLGGDYNGDLLNQAGDQWYYPNKLLAGLYVKDSQDKGLDHLQHAYGSDVKVDKRWTVPGNTDHRIHFVTRTFVAVDDTPGK